MPVQTSVAQTQAIGYAGMRADTSPCDTLSRYNRNGGAIPFGLALVKGSADADAKLPVAGSVRADFIGLAEFTHAYKNYDLSNADGIPNGGMLNLARSGRYLVKVENTVAVGDRAYFRVAANGGNTQLGAWRNDADGVAQVATLTPTAANTTVYSLQIVIDGQVFSYSITSDGTATATEINDAFRALMAADVGFTSLIVASGTTTLILTAVRAGMPFAVTSVGAGVIATVLTTAATATAVYSGFKFTQAASSGGLAVLDLNLP